MATRSEVGGGRRKKRERTPPTEQQIRERQEFNELARREGVTPKQGAFAVAAGITPEEIFHYKVEEPFRKSVLKEYGDLSGLEDPATRGMLWESWLTTRKFNLWEDHWLEQHGPETMAVGLSLPELQSRAVSQTFRWIFETYGSEHAAYIMATAMEDDPERAQRAWEILETIAQKELPFAPNMRYSGKGVTPTSTVVKNTPDDAAIVMQLLDDPDSFGKLSASEQKRAIEIASRVIRDQDKFEALGGLDDIAAEAVLTSEVLMRREGADLVLSPEEKTTLERLLGRVQEYDEEEGGSSDFLTTDVDFVTDEAGELGLTGFREPGDVPIFIFDDKWVKENLSKHAGVVKYLQHLHPNARFQYGEEGAPMRLLQFLDRGVDHISSIFGSSAVAVNESIEGYKYDYEDRAAHAEIAKELRRRLEEGVPEEERAEVISAIFRAEDIASQDVDFAANYERFSSPIQAGTGFGEAMVASLDMYPGDKGYELVHSISTLVGQLVFDPAIVFAKPVKAVTLARHLPAGAAISKSRVTQAMFDMISQPPEMFFASKSGTNVIETLIGAAKTYPDADAFGTRLMRRFGVDKETADMIARAATTGDEAQLRATLLQSMKGLGARDISEASILANLGPVTKQLEQLDEVQRRVKTVQQKLRRRKAARTDTPTLRPVNLSGQKVDRTGQAIGDLSDSDVVWVRTEDLSQNVDQQLVRTGTDTPQAGYDTSLQEEIRRVGYPKPIEVTYDATTGRFEVTDGNHALAAALEMGEEFVPVRTVSAPPADMPLQQAASFVPPTNPRPLTELAPDRFRAYVDEVGEEIAALEAELATLKEARKAGLSKRPELIEQKAYWESVLKGVEHEPVVPLREFPRGKMMRGLDFGDTKFTRFWDAADAVGRALPLHLIGTTYDDFIRLSNYVRSNQRLNKVASRFMEVARRWETDTGAGARIWLERAVVPEEGLADEAVFQSYKNMEDFGRTLGAPDEVLEEWITNVAKHAKSGNRVLLYKAFTEGYVRMIKSATRLDDVGKRALSDMWPELLGERAAEFVRTGKGLKDVKPTLWVPFKDARGIDNPLGVPVWEADMFQGFTLPSYEQIRDYVSATKSFLRSVQKGEAGKMFRRDESLASLYFWATEKWRTFNAAWARAVLVGRMPSALMGRIQLEQMVRIEAFGFSSMVAHPFEWFKSVRRLDDYSRIADSEADVLGVMVRDYITDRHVALMRSGRKTVKLVKYASGQNNTAENVAAVRGVVGRLKAFAASKATRIFLEEKTTAKILERLKKSPQWRIYQPHFDRIIEAHKLEGGPLTSYEKIVARMNQGIKQFIGTGPNAEKVRTAILRNQMVVDDATIQLTGTPTGKKIITDDGNLIADQLLKWFDEGSWTPKVMDIPVSAGDYLPMGRGTIASKAREISDWAFKTFYSRPDLYFGRRPLMRQIAAREYDRLIKLGYSEEKAKEVARTYGARQTADLLFTIGANSSADQTLRSIMPFFPAWKELSKTWLVKVPKSLGGYGAVGWAAGAPALVRKADAFLDFGRENNWIVNENGQWKLRLPFMNDLIRIITPFNDFREIELSGESFASLLPVPSLSEGEPFYKGFLPTVGAPAGLVLWGLKETGVKFFEDLEENLTLYGGNTSLGPAGVDYILNSLGYTPPWQSGSSAEMQENRRYSAYIDGLRVAYAENFDSKPKQEDFPKTKAGERQYVRAYAEWAERLHLDAESSSRNMYLLRGIGGMFLPISTRQDQPVADELNALWEIIEGVEEEMNAQGLTSSLLESFREEYPDLELFLTGKSVRLSPDDPQKEHTLEAYQEEFEHGERVGFTDKQWLLWALGQNELALHRSILEDRVFGKFANTPQEWLLSGYQNTEALRAETIRWDLAQRQLDYLADEMGVTTSDGHPTDWTTMYEGFQKEKLRRSGEGPRPFSRTYEQELATEATDALFRLGDFFGADQQTDDSYLKIRRTLNDIAKKSYDSQDPTFKATGWWWERVRPYFDEKNKIWDKVNNPNTPEYEKPKLYRRLQQIENEWSSKSLTHPKWGKMPDVQKVLFQKLSPEARELKVMGWAKLPVEFLSSFQRQKVFGNSPKDKKLDKLAGIMSENQEKYYDQIASRQISQQSNEGEALKEQMERANEDAAKKLGVLQEYRSWQRPVYKRLSSVIQNPYWSQLEKLVDSKMALLARQDISPRTNSVSGGIAVQQEIVNTIQQYRKQDPEFNRIMVNLSKAYGEGSDKPAPFTDVYWQVFFDGHPSFIPPHFERF